MKSLFVNMGIVLGYFLLVTSICVPSLALGQDVIWEVPLYNPEGQSKQLQLDDDPEPELIQEASGVGFWAFEVGIDEPFMTFLDSNFSGVYDYAGDYDGDGNYELVFTMNENPGTSIHLIDLATHNIDYSFFPESDNYTYVLTHSLSEYLNFDVTGDGYTDLRLTYYQYEPEELVWIRYYSFTGVNTVEDVTPMVSQLILSLSPNPANPLASIVFTLPEESVTTLSIFDASGRLYCNLIDNQWRGQGAHQVTMDHDPPAGVYFIQLSSCNLTTKKKVVVVR
ncbi:T9SS type A sorting domain-containing protein [Patescibacteria group bacterium]|nr:T9SS type A sorting domain-containing protein [Patescibacteria group bacterium]